MSWRDIKAKWKADPDLQRVFDEEYPYASVANAVARLRAKHDLTQAELAERIGTSQSVIARLEGGRHPVSVRLLSRVANALDLDWEPTFTTRGGQIGDAPAARANVPITIKHVFLDEAAITEHAPGWRVLPTLFKYRQKGVEADEVDTGGFLIMTSDVWGKSQAIRVTKSPRSLGLRWGGLTNDPGDPLAGTRSRTAN